MIGDKHSVFYSIEQTSILIDQFQLAWISLCFFKTAGNENAYTFMNHIVLFPFKSVI